LTGLSILSVDIAGFDSDRTIRHPIHVIVLIIGKDVGWDANNVARDRNARVFFVQEDVHIGIVVSED
jgi:hypothetical protein